MNAHPTISLTTTTTKIQNQQKKDKKITLFFLNLK
jgi:hypothetical protein